MSVSPRPPGLVSVVVPAFNAAAFVEETLGTILAQTYSPIEVIVVDDGSTDNTVALIDAMGDERINVVRLPHSGRPAIVRNTGIKNSRGEFIAFCDADDLWFPSKLRSQIALFQESAHTGIVTAEVQQFGAIATAFGFTHHGVPAADFPWMFLGNFLPTSMTVVRASVLDEVGGFDETDEMRVVEDYDLWLRIALRYEIAWVPKILGLKRAHPTNLTRNMFLHWRQLRRLFARYRRELPVSKADRLAMIAHEAYFLSGEVYYQRERLSRPLISLARRFFAGAGTVISRDRVPAENWKSAPGVSDFLARAKERSAGTPG